VKEIFKMNQNLPSWIIDNSFLRSSENKINDAKPYLASIFHIIGNNLLPEITEIKSYKDLQIILAIIEVFHMKFPIEIYDFLLRLDKEQSIEFFNKLVNSSYDKLLKFLDNEDEDKYRYALSERNIDNFALFKLLHINGISWNEYTCSYAAYENRLDCLKYARENVSLQASATQGCPWNSFTFSQAASAGNLDILKYLKENNCPWDESACSSAAIYGKLECLKYLHENGCPCLLASSRREG
jgi:hypothetical protein